MKKNTGLIIGLVVMVVFILLAAVGVGGFFVYRSLNSYEHYLELAEKYLLDEDYEEAIAAYEKAIEIEPMEKDAYLGLAEVYIAMEEYEDALEILEVGYEETSARSLERQIEKLTPLLEEAAAKEEGVLQTADSKDISIQADGVMTAEQEETSVAIQSVESQDIEPYTAVTAKSAAEVEEYANKVKQLFLQHKWSNLAEMIQYPITVDGKTYYEIPDFIKGNFNNLYTNEFMDALAAEDCMDMSCDASGIFMANGCVTIAEADNNGTLVFRIVGINGLTDASKVNNSMSSGSASGVGSTSSSVSAFGTGKPSSDAGSNTSDTDSTSAGNSTASAAASSTVTPDTGSTATASAIDYEALYAGIISAWENDSTHISYGYDYIYLNNDDIPELCLCGNDPYGNGLRAYDLYTIINGTPQKIVQRDRNGTANSTDSLTIEGRRAQADYYIARSGIYIEFGSMMGVAWETGYLLNGTYLDEIYGYSRGDIDGEEVEDFNYKQADGTWSSIFRDAATIASEKAVFEKLYGISLDPNSWIIFSGL